MWQKQGLGLTIADMGQYQLLGLPKAMGLVVRQWASGQRHLEPFLGSSCNHSSTTLVIRVEIK
jgi:hypothetical protein